ncbi:MAG: hypothetical protein K9G37_11435, partial [Crocinitomicaceae bacterium]|nr:hypothetical protein [Crocinitomicaceae bacterium]
MLKNYFLLLMLSFISFMSISQTPIWTEAFQNACASDCPGNGYAGPNGAWSVAASGINGTDANLWYVSGAECGNAAAACGSVCGTIDPSLHISANPSVIGDQGAAYLAGGLGFWDPVTDSRAESPVINLAGQSTMTLTFNYIENGQAAIDDASLWYFDGATWTLLSALAKTPLTCNPQCTWTAFSIAMP